MTTPITNKPISTHPHPLPAPPPDSSQYESDERTEDGHHGVEFGDSDRDADGEEDEGGTFEDEEGVFEGGGSLVVGCGEGPSTSSRNCRKCGSCPGGLTGCGHRRVSDEARAVASGKTSCFAVTRDARPRRSTSRTPTTKTTTRVLRMRLSMLDRGLNSCQDEKIVLEW